MIGFVHIGFINIRLTGEACIYAKIVITGSRPSIPFTDIVRACNAVSSYIIKLDIPVAVIINTVVSAFIYKTIRACAKIVTIINVMNRA